MNSEICFDACRNIYGKSSSTFWGIFIKIPKLIPRVATLLSKALNNRYRLLLLRIDRYPGHFGDLLIKIHLLAFVVVAIKWIIRPKTKKNLFS